MTTCTALYCTSRVSKKIEGISFHKYPKDPKRLEEWLAAVGRREDWRPRHHSTLCSLHFEEDAFDRNSSMKVYLKRDAVPTIFPVAKRKPYKNSKKQPRDPAILHEEGVPLPKRPPAKRARNVTPIAVEKFTKLKPWSEDYEAQITKKSDKKPRDPATLCSDRLFEPLVILQEGSNLYRPKSPQPIILHVRPIAPKKVKKLYPCPEPDATEAQVTKESENQPREYPITLQEPCAESIPMGEVRLIKELEEQPQDIEEFALRNAIDGLSSNELKAPATSKDSKSALEAPVTADGATNSMMNFNMVCPHCQKACKVCLSIKHQLLKTNSSFQTETDKEIRKLKERQLKEQVLRLKKDNLWMRKKVKALEQRNRRLKAKNERLQLKEGNEEGLMVIGTVNGVLNKKDL